MSSFSYACYSLLWLLGCICNLLSFWHLLLLLLLGGLFVRMMIINLFSKTQLVVGCLNLLTGCFMGFISCCHWKFNLSYLLCYSIVIFIFLGCFLQRLIMIQVTWPYDNTIDLSSSNFFNIFLKISALNYVIQWTLLHFHIL